MHLPNLHSKKFSTASLDNSSQSLTTLIIKVLPNSQTKFPVLQLQPITHSASCGRAEQQITVLFYPHPSHT